MNSTGNTITMTGNATGYGLYAGNEAFNISGYDNTLLLDGANDVVTIDGGGLNMIDLNYSGFTGGVTDAIDLGASNFNTIVSSNAVYGSNLAITGAAGLAKVDLANHGGTTRVTLGYTGDANSQYEIGLINSVTLNGDASNFVTYSAGGYAQTTIGQAGDGNFGYISSVALFGIGNSVTGGDENFTITNSTGWGSTVSLGNGENDVSLGGGFNTVALGKGNNILALSGYRNAATLGSGDNAVTVQRGMARLDFAAGDAGATENITLKTATAIVAGGDENFTVSANLGSLRANLGNGNNTVDMGGGRGRVVFGSSTANTGVNSYTSARGVNDVTFNGGVNTVTLGDHDGRGGFDVVNLNSTMLGTSITTAGIFDRIVLTGDANATLNDLSTNGALHVILNADASGGFGDVAITGLSTDDLAQITLEHASTYTITADQTPAGGITLHFDHGSVDLVGLQSVPNNLIS